MTQGAFTSVYARYSYIMREHNTQTLIFLHIPKAAGSTLHLIIDREYEGNYIFQMTGGRESDERFKSLPLEEKIKIKVLKGHMLFGLHKLLPQTSTYITFLRNPVDRVISNYYYVLRTPNHYLHEYVTSRQMTMKDYVDSKKNLQLDNGQVRMLCGGDQYAVPFGGCTHTMLEKAKENLKKSFSVVGLSERFDESLMLLQKAFGWKTPFYKKENVSKDRPSMKNVSIEIIKTIEEDNALDIELYDFAKGLFEEQVARNASFLNEKLKVFRKYNKWYGKTPRSLRRLIFSSWWLRVSLPLQGKQEAKTPTNR